MGRKYDESGFEQLSGWDPRLAVPGGILAAIAVAILYATWPELWAGLAVMGIAAGLITLGLKAQVGLRAEPGRFLVIWKVGSLSWRREIPADETKVRYRYAKGNGWTILIGRSWWTYETFMYLRNEAEAQRWVTFLEDVAAGKRPAMPGKDV